MTVRDLRNAGPRNLVTTGALPQAGAKECVLIDGSVRRASYASSNIECRSRPPTTSCCRRRLWRPPKAMQTLCRQQQGVHACYLEACM